MSWVCALVGLLLLWCLTDFPLTADVFSAGETHENVKLVKTGDGNMEEVVEVETRTDQMVVPAVCAAAAVTVIVITAGFAAMWRFKRKKQQHMEADNQQLV